MTTASIKRFLFADVERRFERLLQRVFPWRREMLTGQLDRFDRMEREVDYRATFDKSCIRRERAKVIRKLAA